MKSLLVFLFLIIALKSVKCAKILTIAPVPTYSHYSLGFRLANVLANKGHEVTLITPYALRTPLKNLREITVPELASFGETAKEKIANVDDISASSNIKFINKFGVGLTNITLADKNVQDLLKSGETFDVVILAHFSNEALMGLAHVFKAPLVLLSPLASGPINNYLFANPAPSAYVPNTFNSFSKHMTLLQRLRNLFTNIIGDWSRNHDLLPQQRKLYERYIKSDVDFDDVLYNASLLLTNSHVSVNDAVPHVPSIIEIGGFHVSTPRPLPEDLKKLLDEATDGVVLFSMGYNLKSKDLKPEVRDSLLRAFSKIKQRVLWKFEDDLPELPKNVKIMNWLPQQDILAHPNVRAFITHGGALSTIETVYYGVPVIAIPVFGDQKSNTAAAVANGYAVSVPLPELTEEKLTWALNEILTNPKYKENVQQRSKLMHDQPIKPIDSAIYWIEHVIRHKGAPHLRSAGLDLYWYQRHLIDIIIFLTLATIVLFAIFYIIIRWLLGTLFRRGGSTLPISKKNV